ncbi:hypothetical protein RU97_GL001796 [Enterococcus canis]|uniref:Uncharacterized protein n=3 Tax=Enterococcus canis TaxID=214095 RepID=A0A1L8RF52_9ENTE|nr:hypothetical protein RU97_GL001796 [Enterococcus canis]
MAFFFLNSYDKMSIFKKDMIIMEELDWNDLTQNSDYNSGCGIFFMFVIFLGMAVLLITVKTADYFLNTPEEQIQRTLRKFEKIPPYDPRDNSFQVKKLEESSNEMSFEVTIKSSDFKEKDKVYSYVVKAKVTKRLIFTPKLEIYSVVRE